MQPVCPTCATVQTTRAYNRTLDATSRYAFLSFRHDETTANQRSLAEVDRDLSALVSRIQAEPNSRTFIADNGRTGFGPPALHVITTQSNPQALQRAHADFIGAMVSGTGWTSQRFVMPRGRQGRVPGATSEVTARSLRNTATMRARSSARHSGSRTGPPASKAASIRSSRPSR